MSTTSTDPALELFSATDLIPKTSALDEFVEKCQAVKFCEAGRSKDHRYCQPLEALDDALKLLAPLGLSIWELMPGKRNRLAIGQWLHARLSASCARGMDVEFGGAKRTLETELDLAQYLSWRVTELKVPTHGTARAQPEVPETYWDCKMQCYCVQNIDNEWQHENRDNVVDRLIAAGLDPVHAKGELSQVDQALLNIRNENTVSVMMDLAGYTEGLHYVNGMRILVPSSFKMIEAKPGEPPDFPHVWAVLSGALMRSETVELDKETKEQRAEREGPFWYFLSHLQSSILSLQIGQKSGSLVTFLCGPVNSGKTLILETIVTPLLGGRWGSAYLYVSGQTSFNDELMSKETWLIDDGVPLSDYVARKRFGGLLKQAAAANSVPCHPKGKAQKTLPLFRRLYIALNPDDIETLPPLSESLGDKYMLLKTKNFIMPEGCLPLPVPAKRPEFAAKILEELPFFLGWLMNLDLTAFHGQRFGTFAYKDPELETEHAEVGGSDVEYKVLCKILFSRSTRDAVELSTADIWTEIMSSSYADLARQTFRTKISLGMALGSLSRSHLHQKFVQVRIKDGYKQWTIMNSELLGSLSEGKRFTGKNSENKD